MRDPFLKRFAFAGKCLGIAGVGDKDRDGRAAAPDQAVQRRHGEYGASGQQRFSFAVQEIPGEDHARRGTPWGETQNTLLGSHRRCFLLRVSNAASLPQRRVDENISPLFHG